MEQNRNGLKYNDGNNLNNYSQRNSNININNTNYHLKMRKLLHDDIGKNLLAKDKEEKFGFKNNRSNLNVQQSDIIKMRKTKKPFENNINFNIKKILIKMEI